MSFRDVFTLTMIPDALKERPDYLHIPYLYDVNARLLKSVSIYGHNSHGKSNLVKAFSFFQNFILTSSDQNADEIINIENFRLNSTAVNKPSFFEAVFYLKETKFRYGFKVTTKAVFEEWLYYAEPKVRENYLFHRIGQEIKVSKTWHKDASEVLDKSIHYTQGHQLLLSSLMASRNLPTPIDKIGTWIKGSMIFMDITEERHLKYALMILASENYRPLINRLINTADLGFTTIIDKIDRLTKDKLALSEDLLKTWYKTELKEFSLFSQHNFFDKDHKLIDTITFEFLKSESAGTIRFLMLACFLVYAIKQGQLIIVDEIDSKFHSLLLQTIIEFYNDAKINVQGSQMIFTTHNTVLMNDTLRRDQIILIEKNEFGESLLKKAHTSTTPIRIDSSIEKDYRKGKLGGVSKKLKKDDHQSSFDF